MKNKLRLKRSVLVILAIIITTIYVLVMDKVLIDVPQDLNEYRFNWVVTFTMAFILGGGLFSLMNLRIEK